MSFLCHLLPRALARGRIKIDEMALAKIIFVVVGLKSSHCFCNLIHDLKVVAIEKFNYV